MWGKTADAAGTDRTPGTCERAWISGQTPPEELVKCRGAVEHASHESHARDIPNTDGTVERTSAVEHPASVRHARDVPRTEVVDEYHGIVECGLHVRHARDVPRTDATGEHRGIV